MVRLTFKGIDMSDTVLGKNPKMGAQRDAVHVAVLPVKTDYSISPGSKVVIIDRNSDPITVSTPMGDEYDGVLDPFSDGSGDTFWMLVAPHRMMSGVRHDWTLSDNLADDIEPQDDFCCQGQRN